MLLLMGAQSEKAERTRRITARADSVGWLKKAALLLALCTASACGLALDNDALIERARQAEAEGDLRAAVVDLRTVLQKEPDNMEARLLLGSVALKSGDGFEAERSLRKAVELGVPMSEVVENLGMAMLNQGSYDAVLNEIQTSLTDDPNGKRAILRIRGEANLGLARNEQSDLVKRQEHVQNAEALFAEAVEQDPTDSKAKMGLAAALLMQGQRDQARNALDETIAVDPGYPRAFVARGKLNLEDGELDAAVADFTKAEELATAQRDLPLTIAAISGLADTHFARQDLSSVKAASKRLNAVAPETFAARFLSARVAFAEKDYKVAGDYLQDILRVQPNWEPAQLLYGMVNLYEGNYQQAESHFRSVLARQPNNGQARQGLVEARRLQQDATGALELLAPSLGEQDASSELLAKGGRLSLQAGDVDGGVELLERATASDPGNMQRQLDLAIAYLAAGDTDKALATLESMPENSESEYGRSVLLILTKHQRGEIEQAQADLDALITEYGDDQAKAASLWNLKGGLRQRAGDLGAASTAYSRALELDENNLGARLNLARIQLSQGDNENARGNYLAALEAQPENAAAMTGLAQLAFQAGDTPAAVSWLEKAREADANALRARLLLGAQYLRLGDSESAAEVSAEAYALAPNGPDSNNLDGLVKLASGNYSLAEARFAAAMETRPDEPQYAFNRARTLMQLQRRDQAYEIVSDVYLRHPEHQGNAVLYAALLGENGKWEDAYKVSGDLQSRFPESSMGYSIEADLLAAQGKNEEALAKYEDAYERQAGRKLAMRISQVRLAVGADQPEVPLVDYVERHPDDVGARVMLAQTYQVSGQMAEAVSQYERAASEDFANASVLNNLAWLYHQQGDSRAEETAKRAHDLAKNNAQITDTYGWILLNNGKLEKAERLLRDASEQSPDSCEIRYHYAVALSKTGQSEEAKDILGEILGSDCAFSSRADAASMLKNL